jgi:hypothetical protein
VTGDQVERVRALVAAIRYELPGAAAGDAGRGAEALTENKRPPASRGGSAIKF